MARQPASSSTSVISAIDAKRTDADKHVSEYATNASSNDLTVDGSSSSVTFSVAPTAGHDLEVSRIILYMESTLAMDSTEFGNLAALTNGVQIVANGEVLTTWQDNIDILCDMFDLSPAGEAFGKLTETLGGRWTFAKDTNGLALLIPEGQTFDVVVRDDLTNLVVFRVKVKGRLLVT